MVETNMNIAELILSTIGAGLVGAALGLFVFAHALGQYPMVGG